MKTKLLLAVSLAFPLTMVAQDDNDYYDATYLRIGAGVSHVEDLEGFVDSAVAPRLNFDYSFDPGVRVDFAPGLNFNQYFAFELNTGITWNSLDGIEVGGQSQSADGDLIQVPILANFIAKVPTQIGLTPFIGAGGGGVYTRLAIGDVNGVEVDDSGDDFFGAFQLFGGLTFEVTEGCHIGAAYNFMHVFSNDEEFSSNGDRAGLDDLTTHSITAIVTIDF
jgi:opacity protein-like surface antigen